MLTPDETRRTFLVNRLACLESIEPEYYVDSADTDDHPDHTHSWCRKHADMVARIESMTIGASMHICESWSEVDVASRCEWRGCDVALRPSGGGLTDYGVDNSLGLTEEKVLEVHVYPAELVMAWQAMARDDPRWPVWEWHACKLLKLTLPKLEVHEGCHGVVLFRHEGWKCTRCKRLCPTHVTGVASCLTCVIGEGIDGSQ